MTTTDQDGVTINTLPDNVLVDIFIFYFNTEGDQLLETLLRVCQRWRALVLASPRQLELESVYTGTEPVSEFARDIRPTWPVGIRPTDYSSSICRNITAFLNSKHRHCIHAIFLWSITASELKKLVAAMQKPFPELKYLGIYVNEGPMTPLPDSLLGRSAPLLRQLVLNNCPFPGMPKLLLSATHLCHLDLRDIPHSGYFSPQDLGAALSVMSRLEFLRVEFESPRYPESRHPLSLTRSVLPSLTKLVFEGAHQYLEDLLAQIEAPLLSQLKIVFSEDPHFVVPQLHELISHAEAFKKCHRAIVHTSDHAIRFSAFRELHSPELSLIGHGELDQLLSSFARLFNSSLSFLSTLEQLDFLDISTQTSKNGIEITQWLELLEPFTSVTDLRLQHQIASHVCRALEELAEERVKQVLPALQKIFLIGVGESVPKYMQGFVAARQLFGHPVAVCPWDDYRKTARLHHMWSLPSD